MSDPNNLSTFVQVGPTIFPSATSVWEEKLILFNNYSGTGRFIAIIAESTGSTSVSFYIDDFKIETIPTCPKPQFLNANTTDVTATPFWTESGSALEWEVEWGLSTFTQGQGTIASITDTFLPLSSLTQNTSYKFYVRAICGLGDTSLWSGPFVFTTQALTGAPYIEPFTSMATPVGFSLSSFSIGAPAGIPGNPANNIYTNLYSGTPTANFSTINIGPLGTNYSLAFDYSVALWSAGGQVPTGSGNFIVAISTDWGVTYTNVDTVDNNGLAGYQPYSFDLSAYDTDIIKIKITGNWISSDYYLGIDNIYVGPAITCPIPNNLTSANATQTTVDLSWTENGTATEWVVEYGPIGFTLGTGTSVQVLTNPTLSLVGLTATTCYDAYVRAV